MRKISPCVYHLSKSFTLQENPALTCMLPEYHFNSEMTDNYLLELCLVDFVENFCM